MVGLPRSGKSTKARTLAYEKGFPIVSGDAIRLALHGQRYIGEAEFMVRPMKLLMIRALFAAGHSVVISDDTHYSMKARDFVRQGPWTTRFWEVDTPEAVCLQRANATNQPDLVPVIQSMAKRFEPLEEWEDTIDPKGA